MWSQSLALPLAAIAAACLTACSAGTSPAPDEAPYPSDPCRSAEHRERLEALLASRKARPDSADYVVGPGDLLVVTIYNYRPEGGDFSSRVRVDDRGYVSLPMMDPVHVAGLSVARIRREVVYGLRRADVLREPLVSIFHKDYQGQQVVVLGAVNRPGTYPLSRARQTLVDVLSMAGGMARSSGNAVLLRPAPRAGHDLDANPAHQASPFAAAALDPSSAQDADMISICIESNGSGTNPALMMLAVRGGDIVVVPEAGLAYIDGEVSEAGPYPLSRGFTLTQMITSAGGLKFPADRSRIKLIRPNAPEGHAEWDIDLEQIHARARPDILLQRNDRVVVPHRLGRKIVYGVYQTVTTIVRVTVGGAATIF